MLSYIIRRLISGVLILVILSLVVFTLLRVVSGDQATTLCGFNCTPPGIKAAQHLLGLDKPYFPIGLRSSFPFVLFHADNQYMTWIKDLATGHLGSGKVNQQPVLDLIRHRLPVTIELLIITVILTIAIGVPAGIISALYRNSIGDHVVRVAAVLGLAVPTFWVATLVIYFPAHWWGYAAPAGRAVGFFQDPIGNMRQFGPPAAVLGLASAAGIMRLTRSSLLEVMRTDYIRTARSKGLRETSVVSRHALKNSLIPVITVLGLQVAGLLGGAVIIEQIFALPGIGLLEYQSLLSRDNQVVQSLTLYIGAAVVLMNLLVDISYAWLDPRIRYS
jgi:peptide/nickel transport system permease protein